MGGVGQPNIQVKLKLDAVDSALGLHWDRKNVLLPDLVNGKPASLYASILLRNDGYEDVEVIEVEADVPYISSMLSMVPIALAPQQSRPVALNLSCNSSCDEQVTLTVFYRTKIQPERVLQQNSTQMLHQRSIYEPHKITFLHPSGIVSYAVLRPPSAQASRQCTHDDNLPVLLQLHGAGLEAEADLVAHALDPLPDLCAWVLFPTGVTPWSGDDWHNWGFADVEAAVDAIPDWIKANGWKGPAVDTERWLVSGHSNGGQGTWYALTHRPDKVLAAAPVSGYTSIQNYVPYNLWQSADPQRHAIVQSSLNSYRHESLMANARDIPILQQHGSNDDNVPAYHSRLLWQLIQQTHGNSSYHELPGKGHWFDGVMTTDALREFYQSELNGTKLDKSPMGQFTLVVANPGDMGSSRGIKVLSLELPGHIGSVDVSWNRTSGAWSLETSNVLILEMPSVMAEIGHITIDRQRVVIGLKSNSGKPVWRVLKNSTGMWEVRVLQLTPEMVGRSYVQMIHNPFEFEGIAYRRGRQLGAMDAILRSHGPFLVRSSAETTKHIALQISRNLCQYFAADTVLTNMSSAAETTSNIVTVAMGAIMPAGLLEHFPIRVWESKEEQMPTCLEVRDDMGTRRCYRLGNGLAAIFLRPLPDEGLELVVWGEDESSVAVAARLVPMLTGVGQPDFIVMDKRMFWKGVDGVLAMGFFDHWWNVSRNSVFS
ncbi:hypothetical protein LTR50_002268 [Elasticomyces elasticus]|nr:hypothetical protein LTR50_002268 [Elasticomyces elasticus]